MLSAQMPGQAAVMREEGEETESGCGSKSQPALKETATIFTSYLDQDQKHFLKVLQFTSSYLGWNRITSKILNLFTLILSPFIGLNRL